MADALSGGKDGVQLVRFSPCREYSAPESPSVKSNRKFLAPDSPSASSTPLITASGRISPRCPEIPPLSPSEQVRLVRFKLNQSLRHNDNNDGPRPFRCKMNGDFRESSSSGKAFVDPTAFEKERQERLSRLMNETQEWFSRIREDNHRWRTGSSGGLCHEEPSERMSKFFQEAQEKFSAGNKDVFDQFVRENQERFAQLLDDNGMNSIFSDPHAYRPTSMCFESKSGFFNGRPSYGHSSSSEDFFQQKRPGSSASSSPTPTVRNGHSSGASETSTSFSSSTNNTSTNFASNSSCSEHSSRTMTENSSSSHQSESSFTSCEKTHVTNGSSSFSSYSNSGPSCATNTDASMPNPGCTNSDSHNNSSGGRQRPPHFQTFPDFTRFSSSNVNLSSPTRMHFGSGLNCHHSGVRNSSYQMTTSRSTFEYCGSTNTYRFSTEHVTQTYEQGYESISESEDEEESVEDATSTLGEPSEFGDDTSSKDVDARSDSGCMLALEYETKKDKVNQTLHKIATELLTTERTFVSILHLLDQVFSFRVDQENRAHPMFPQEVVTQMFCNLKSLYKLHHDFLLPQLEERMENWETERRIGDIMKNFAPFLKMYTEYVKNYDNAMNLINLWYQKQPRFAHIMDEIHQMEECGNLTLQHHMLTPVQRVPRYQLLLKDYLKKLPEDSPDREDTEKALELVSTAANHANEAMKKIDKFKKLLEIQEMIGGVVDLVSPTRELIKEGKIIKISARNGDHQERYLFLFNDLLLLCSQRLIANRVVSGPIFRVRARLGVEGLIIEEGDNLETANTFYIRNSGRTIELYTQTPEEKLCWMEALAKAVHDLFQRKSSLRIGDCGLISPDADLGRRAPTLIKLDGVSHCMVCGSQFSTFAFKRKHHCRACGIVACNKCLSHKVPLAYDDNKAGRVCNHCHDVLLQRSQEKGEASDDSQKENVESPIRRKGILEVRPTDASVISGYLFFKARSRSWVRRFFLLDQDFVLYSFRTHEDERALTSMPVPGYTVGLPEKGDSIDSRDNVFKVFYHKKKIYYFQAPDSTEMQRWMSALERASRAESS